MAAVRSLLGTRTLKETVDDAFNEVLALAERRRAGFSSTSPASHQAMRQQRSAWPFVQMTQQTLDRSVAGLLVLHYDYDFELIATITGQPTEWILPPGEVP